ncbi:MAG: NADH:ubiquinone reductase (Na(+)-transporting) subunit B [Flavobacteriales bacterium]|nr:NADH:ubiquinone reductase (Na(+)-transporting) subunit B [Flavobacteriales bacterium]MDG1440822.1 NADH:ubiquinone reductase (Na(+)-transporting) subunit B [Flavobacteriales bacterium]MDG1797557.1 NADH:ubiquinone reductase (Na(+)-transporting) subunit B [Flavobacteriales bacterium]
MEFLRKIFDNAHEKLNSNEKTKKFFPLIDAFDTLMFTPNHVTNKGSHIRDAIDLKRTMMLVIIALIPCLLFGIYNTGYQHFRVLDQLGDVSFWEIILKGALVVLPLVVVSYGAGLLVEFIFAIRNGHTVQEGFLVSGMLIPLCMPADVPLWMVAVATMFAVVIGKEVFGGTGMNILNVALTARAFLFFAHPTKMSGNEVWVTGFSDLKGEKYASLINSSNPQGIVDGSSGATALGDLASFMQDSPVLENTQAFQAKYSLMDSFLGFIPGSVGETSALMCLIGAGILLWTGIASWRVISSFFIGGFIMASILNFVGGNGYFELPAIHQLMLGGFMFGMVFMATDPVTAAHTNTGKFIYGFLGGFLGILIRMVNPAYPEGIMLAILIANVFAPLIDHMVIQSNINRRLKRLKTA